MKHNDIKTWCQTIDWSQSDSAIAALHSLQAQTVRARRKSYKAVTLKQLKQLDLDAWAATVDWSYCDSYIAKQHWLNINTVRNTRIRLGIPIGKLGKNTHLIAAANRKIQNPEQLDWQKNDAFLAKQCKVSRERMRQLRKKLGMPDSPEKGMTNKRNRCELTN